MRWRVCAWMLVCANLVGCDQSASERTVPPAPLVPPGLSVSPDGQVVIIPEGPVGLGEVVAGDPLALMLSATDDRSPVVADTPPPAIAGGTLALSRDGAFAIAADPDRDRVSVIDLVKGKAGEQGSSQEVTLPKGSEPGRVATDAQGRAHVALRRQGTVLTFDVASASVLYERAVCAAPRGLAMDDANGLLVVACEDGVVVELPLEDGEVLSRVYITEGLRDIEVDADTYLISVFKTSEILRIDRQGNVLARSAPQTIQVGAFFGLSPLPDPHIFDGGVAEVNAADPISAPPSAMVPDTAVPRIAWRMHKRADGSLLMLHGMASQRVIPTVDEFMDAPSNDNASPYGGTGAGGCSSLANNAVTVMPSSLALHPLPGVLNMPGLVVDVAEHPSRNELAFARPGAADPELPLDDSELRSKGATDADLAMIRDLAEEELRELSSTLVIGDLSAVQGVVCPGVTSVEIDGQVTAVAYTPDGTLLAQSREPAALFFVNDQIVQSRVSLGGDSVLDSGHELFHRNSGGGIACAQCHPEGGEDGHVWNFEDVGVRRTQPLFVGLSGTAPFHWGGDLDSMGQLMDDVFAMRMGGAHQTQKRVDVFSQWLFSLAAPPPPLTEDDPAAQRGKVLFESLEVGCMDCHSGANFSDNQSHDVAISSITEETQTPSLRGVAYRAPYMHNGCAATLRDRFDTTCGGINHGNVSNLSEEDITDLIAYLRSL